MASNYNDLPEGTDRTIPGAGISGADETPVVAERDEDRVEDISPVTAEDTLEPASERSGTGAGDADKPAIDWSTTREKLAGAGADLKGQATDRVRAYAVSGKDAAVSGLDSFTKLIDDAASTVDDKVGEQYGTYVRQASEAFGGFADTLRNKDVDELFADVREAVKKSPGVAIGAAAAIGFVLARVVQAGFEAARTPGAESDDEKAA